jgi:hypothetical protein
MNEDQKQRLTRELSVRGNFNRLYTAPNRNWFTRKIINYSAASGDSDSQIREKVIGFIRECKQVVSSKQNFNLAIDVGRRRQISNRRRRVEIIYGVLVSNPELINSTVNDYLEFIIKRRYRGVMRMDYIVNPNRQGYFRYPSTCRAPSLFYYRVNNPIARTFWENINNHRLAIKLQPSIIPGEPPTHFNPLEALRSLFISKDNPCEGNLLDCGRVMTIMMMDSLREARDPDRLLGMQYATEPNRTFLSIYSVTDASANGFIEYDGERALFETPGCKVEDLVVGDHVYIFNHPLYKVFEPDGSWSGEHALVYNLGNRNLNSRNGYRFGGHGKEGTLYQFYNAFLKDLRTYLHESYKISKIHLDVMSGGLPALPSGAAVNSSGPFNLTLNEELGEFMIYDYSIRYQYRDYNRQRLVNDDDFLIFHGMINSINVFVYGAERNISDISGGVNEGSTITLTRPVYYVRTREPGAGESVLNPLIWGIHYRSHESGSSSHRFFYPFKEVRGHLRLNLIEMSDLFDTPLALVSDLNSDVYCTRPKVDLNNSSYLSYLRSSGAL